MEKKFSKMIAQIMDNDDIKNNVDTQLVNEAEMAEVEDGEDGSMDSSREPNLLCEDIKTVDLPKFLVEYKPDVVCKK